jgi:hypothetical protein
MYARQEFKPKQKLKSEELNRIEDALAIYTELARAPVDKHKGGKKTARVICHGLVPGKTYAIHLYTSARRGGRQQDPWRHPSNENTGKGYTGKGYANLVATSYAGEKLGSSYPDAPGWMPRGGILQTEWTIVAAAETQELKIELGTWLLPMLKPLDGTFGGDRYGLLGVANKCKAPLLFKFCVVKDGVAFECKNTLRVGAAKGSAIVGVSALGAIPDDNLYISIK